MLWLHTNTPPIIYLYIYWCEAVSEEDLEKATIQQVIICASHCIFSSKNVIYCSFKSLFKGQENDMLGKAKSSDLFCRYNMGKPPKFRAFAAFGHFRTCVSCDRRGGTFEAYSSATQKLKGKRRHDFMNLPCVSRNFSYGFCIHHSSKCSSISIEICVGALWVTTSISGWNKKLAYFPEFKINHYG